jgi:hypothetical protein
MFQVLKTVRPGGTRTGELVLTLRTAPAS